MSINERISGKRQSDKVSSTVDSSISLDKYKELESVMKKAEEDRFKRERLHVKANAENQAKVLLQLELAGIKITAKERAKVIKQFEEQQRNDNLKTLIEHQKKSYELQREYNRLLLDEDSGATFRERVDAIKEEAKANIKQQVSTAGLMKSAIKLFDNLTQEFNSIMSEYAKYQLSINTRLQGSAKSFEDMAKTLRGAVGVSPYIKTQSMFENLNKLTELGIVYNLEQRAFLETIADNISTTFDATNGALLRLIRLQQSDSTAARLGLETAVTQYLTQMYEDSSYLNDSFKSVSEALIEATSQMTNEVTIQFEYIVQKWLGSLASVGLSDATVTNLATALGYLGSGNIAGLEGMEGMRNLLIMASSRDGSLNYADMLSQGLDASQTNRLLRSVVEYIQEIASTNNKVIQSQYAGLFGITLSDMTAAKNLRDSLDEITLSTLDYSQAMGELVASMNTMSSRMSIATKMDTLWSNLQFGLASGIAENSALYGLWKVTDLIQGLTDGINIPFVTAVGTGVDVNTTVENLMKLGIVGVSSLKMIPELMRGLGGTIAPSSMLTRMGISLTEVGTTRRGDGLQFSRAPRGVTTTTSESTFVGTGSPSDMEQATLGQAEHKAQEKLRQQQQDVIDYTKLTAEHTKSTSDYLTNVLNPKMDAMVTMMAKVASYSLRTGSGEAFSETDLSSLMLGKATGVVVSEDKKNEARLDIIGTIGTNVSEIVDLLRELVEDNRGLLAQTSISNLPF